MERSNTLLLCRYYRNFKVDGEVTQARLEVRVPTRRLSGEENLALVDIRNPKMKTRATINLFLKGAAPSQNRICLTGGQIGSATMQWREGAVNHYTALALSTWSINTVDRLKAFAQEVLVTAIRASFPAHQTIEWVGDPRFLDKPEILQAPV